MPSNDPVVAIELFLFTADGCEMLTVYPVNEDGSLGAPVEGGWSDEPAEETEGGSLSLLKKSGARLECPISGNQHRDLEDGDAYDTLLTRLIQGEDFSTALTVALASRRRRPRP